MSAVTGRLASLVAFLLALLTPWAHAQGVLPVPPLTARVIDQTGKKISLASFKTAPLVKPNKVLQMIEEHNQSLDLEPFPALGDILREGKTMRIIDTQLPFAVRLIFNSQLDGKAALVAPVRVAGQAFGQQGKVSRRAVSFQLFQ